MRRPVSATQLSIRPRRSSSTLPPTVRGRYRPAVTSPACHPERGSITCSQAGARSRDVAGDLVLVPGQEPSASNHCAAVDDDGLSLSGRSEREARDQVLDSRVREVVDPEARDVGALARFERAAVVAAETLGAPPRRQAPGGTRGQRPRRRIPHPRKQQGLMCFHREVRVLIADRKSTRLNSSHSQISYAVFCLKKKNEHA